MVVQRYIWWATLTLYYKTRDLLRFTLFPVAGIVCEVHTAKRPGRESEAFCLYGHVAELEACHGKQRRICNPENVGSSPTVPANFKAPSLQRRPFSLQPHPD